MMVIKIIKDAPIPRKFSRNKYPWADMSVGDSFVAEVKQSALLTACRSWRHANEPDWEFRSHKVEEHPPKTQIWRIK